MTYPTSVYNDGSIDRENNCLVSHAAGDLQPSEPFDILFISLDHKMFSFRVKIAPSVNRSESEWYGRVEAWSELGG